MRIAVPTTSDLGLDAVVSSHFGHAPAFTIVDEESGETEVQPNLNRNVNRFCGEALVNRDVHTVVCTNLGQGARRRLLAMGASVYVGASGTVRDALDAYRAGRLREATDADVCAEHDHQHGHGGEHDCGQHDRGGA